MLNSSGHDHVPLLEKFLAPRLQLPTFSRTWIICMVVTTQIVLCGLIWAFAGVMIVKQIIPLPINLATWVYNNQSETNFIVTMISTALGMVGSFLLGITVQHALVFRLSRSGVHLSMATAWIQLARNSLFLQPRRHLWWTLLSVLWVAVIHFMTTAWSNLLTPVTVLRQFTATGREVDFLSPVLANYTTMIEDLPFVPPTARNLSLTPDSLHPSTTGTSVLSQAGRSAALGSIDPGYPAFVDQFNSSSGKCVSKHLGMPERDDNESYQAVPTPYIFRQQGFTANISCMTSSSPIIILNNNASAEYTFKTPSGELNYTFQTWSWSTNCSGNGEYYTGDVNLLTSDYSQVGNGLFATSVCYYQDFSGPSNQSFLVLMQSTNNYPGYHPFYNLPTVCQVTPLVTTVEVQYNQSGLVNVNKVLEQALLPDDCWPLASYQATAIWSGYLLAQGPYSNSLADDVVEMVLMVNPPNSVALALILEQYLQGIVEYAGSMLRQTATQLLEYRLNGQVPDNMTVPITGTMTVQVVGWQFHPRTHGIALAVITMITAVTAAAGIFALLEANSQKTGRDSLQRGSAAGFDPTNLMDVLVASSNGSLASALSQPSDEKEREKMVVELGVTVEGQSMLNTRTDGADDASEREFD
ncbi:hypothetical protein V8E55_000205 [Tylopilus felleus]